MKFKIQIDGAEHEIEATSSDAAGGISVKLGEQTFDVKVGSPASDRRVVQLGDKSYEVRVAENCADTGIFVLEIAGERVPVTVSDVVHATRAATAPGGAATALGTAPGTVPTGAEGAPAAAPLEVKHGVWAPVPGKIVNVMVAVGDKVEEGTPVVVLEAMKMENELHSPVKGTVTAVLVKKGDSADKGQLLVAFE